MCAFVRKDMLELMETVKLVLNMHIIKMVNAIVNLDIFGNKNNSNATLINQLVLQDQNGTKGNYNVNALELINT